MTVNPGAGAIEGHTELMVAPATLEKLARAYIATYHGPHGDAPVADAVTGPVDMSAAGRLMSPNLLSAHYRLGRRRQAGETLVEVYPSDDPGGFGPAIQIVTDHATLLMDSVTVLLHRLGVAYKAIMNPILRVRRDPIRRAARHPARRRGRQVPERRRRGVDPRPAVQFRRSQGRRRGQATAAERDGRRPPGRARLAGADGNTARPGQRTRHRPRGALPRRRSQGCRGAAAMARRRAFRPARAISAARSRAVHASVDSSSRLGILRFRDEILPQLTDSDDLLVLAQATIPELPALRRLPLHRRRPRTPRASGDRAPLLSACSRSRR